MPLLSDYARRRKTTFFSQHIPANARILEIGSADGWFIDHLRRNGWPEAQGIDLAPPADIIGDIRDWRALGIEPASFDVLVAFEVVEHVPCFQEACDILKPGGLLMLTSPLPSMDWLCRVLERFGLNQKRTSPHDHLIAFTDIPLFEPVEIHIIGLMAQWGIFRKPANGA